MAPLPLSLLPGAHPRTRHAGTVLHYKLEPTARGGLLVISLPTPVGQRSCPSLLSSCLIYFLVLSLVALSNPSYA